MNYAREKSIKLKYMNKTKNKEKRKQDEENKKKRSYLNLKKDDAIYFTCNL